MWIPSDATPINLTHWSKFLGIHPLTAQLLANRGITELGVAQQFLATPLSALHNPFLLPDMDKAVGRILSAVQNKEPITVFGDYDTDGVCGTALLARFFRALGVDVACKLPHRTRDGYGLQAHSVDAIADAGGGGLLITVDNGSSAVDAVTRAHQRGMDVIITDHHQLSEQVPQAVALVNPQRSDSHYPFKGLCGTGIVFKLMMALRHRLREQGSAIELNLAQFLPLVAIATIADVVPLTDENRILTKQGLARLPHVAIPGLVSLMRLAGVSPDQVSSDAVAFRISPRINAAGRMEDPMIALQCLLSDNPLEASDAAQHLHTLNAQRQLAEQAILKEVKIGDTAGIALASDQWPTGIVGIVAGRLAQQYGRPTVIVSFENGTGRGSMRTIAGVDALAILHDCRHTLANYGGHRDAAGITIAPDQWEAFQSAFHTAVTAHMPKTTLRDRHMDAVVTIADITTDLAKDIQKLAPFGAGNPEPVFAVRDISQTTRRQVGQGHLKMAISNTLTTIEAIGFRLWDHPQAQSPISTLIGVPEINDWNGEVQLRLLDLNPELSD